MWFNDQATIELKSVLDNAFDSILAKGNANHRRIVNAIRDSDMLINASPVSVVKASGITGIIDPRKTKAKIAAGRMSIREALGEVFITFATETLGSRRGTEGTLVHEMQHAYDFARTIASLSNVSLKPLGIFDPTLYELELAAHRSSGEWMLLVGEEEYTSEGVDLMILGRDGSGTCFLHEEGIHKRLSESYKLSPTGNQGPRASELMGLRIN
ncbi:hypothetical protein [Leptolyngbya sp. 7M]|uniref:hypothetical protein n=1 Tax=Leptolyngbya sp. 7M TaxID=2812896 RepID=UPI001B8C5248|nr:hypothetical protein [Leptolyngbya sp. 7M]QYO66940.1 mitochondrial inner membrane protease ATP23 [Leptolyngbya sp. 7M]